MKKLLLLAALLGLALVSPAQSTNSSDEDCWRFAATNKYAVYFNACTLKTYKDRIRNIPVLP